MVGLYGTFYVVLFWPDLFPLAWVAGLYALKVSLQTGYLLITLRQAGHRENLNVLLLYELYLCLMSLAVLAYTALPGKIEWKQRCYARAKA